MEKSMKTGAQIYGYTVCLVAVITFLISITSMFDAIMQRQDPLHSGWSPAGSPSLASFDNYKMDILKSVQAGDPSKGASFVPDDQTIRGMFEAAKNDKIQSVMHNSGSTIIITSITLCICIVLFVTHWLWMRKKFAPETTAALAT